MANVVYIPNPIDTTNLPAASRSKSKTVLFLGWVINTKGIEELISAWKNVHLKHNDWQLKLVGPYNNEYYSYLEKHYDLNGIIFDGEKDHQSAMEILNEAEIFILPSYTEGFPNVILEAMALAKPIIATNVGAISDMLLNNCGILIEPKQSECITEALNKLIEDENLRNTLGENAYNKLVNNYTIDNIFNKYLSIWKDSSKLVLK